jgi:hypothetical protein
MSGSFGRVFRRAGLALAGLLVGVLLAEVGVRVSGVEARFVEPLIPRQRADPSLHQPSPDPELIYRLKPNSSLRTERRGPYGDAVRNVSINSLGFRDPERVGEKPDGLFRVLVLGGSNTYGAAVGDDATWPRLLEDSLRGSVDVPLEVWNLGISGYTTRQKVRLAEIAVPRFRPDLILIQLYNTGPRYFLDAMTPRELANGAEADREFLFGVPRGMGFSAYEASALVRLAVVVRNRRARAVAPHDHVRMLMEVSEPVDAAALSRMETISGGAPVVGVVTPAGFPERQLAESGVSVIDLGLSPPPEGREAEAADIHPGGEVYAWYAGELARQLRLKGCLPPMQESRCASGFRP